MKLKVMIRFQQQKNKMQDVSIFNLEGNLGAMYKRQREAVIRFHRFNLSKEPEKVYRSKLMLYLPWRNEDVNIIGGYTSFKA